ncbi:MAG TPA: hypothetical protein VHM19_04840 [Polyangiales bacterium]|nr:hypothetical protein [Polyangiales bacterium]
MQRDFARRATALSFALAAWLLAPAAYAYEDQASLGVQLGYAHAVFDAAPRNGAVVGAEASLGLSDIWTVRGGFSYGFHPDDHPLSMFVASAELLYLVDVFELVPYFGAGIDGLGALRNSNLGLDFGVHPVLGLDWLPERNLVFGLEARPVFLLSALDHDPVYLTLALSGSLLFDL